MTDFDTLAAVGLVSANIGGIWLIAHRFETKVESVVARHTQTILATFGSRVDDAAHKADNANLNALTVNRNHNDLVKRVDHLEVRVTKLEGMP